MLAGLILAGATVATAQGPAANPSLPEDDRTFRPTVVVRRGASQGSGTVIASVPGETLVLTAAHVVTGEGGSPSVEVHRYNMGVERALPARGWPVVLQAEVAAADPAADIAVLRVRGRAELPFVATLAPVGDEPRRGAVVTSVGIDAGAHLRSWRTRVRETAWFVMAPAGPEADDRDRAGDAVASGARGSFHLRGRTDRRPDEDLDDPERPFLITARAPEMGRSGGGLFSEAGALVGVCVGRIESERGRERAGVFASGESVRRLLLEHELDAVVARFEALRARPAASPARAQPSPVR
jgi:S1-C subfamily serine protease